MLDLLARLVDKSLVIVETSTVRRRATASRRSSARTATSGSSQADEAADARRRHRDWCLQPGRAAPPWRSSEAPRPPAWLDRLDAGARQPPRGARVERIRSPASSAPGCGWPTGLWRFWEIRGHVDEGRHWLERHARGDAPATRLAAPRQCAHRRRHPGLHAGRLSRPPSPSTSRASSCIVAWATRSARRVCHEQRRQRGLAAG